MASRKEDQNEHPPQLLPPLPPPPPRPQPRPTPHQTHAHPRVAVPVCPTQWMGPVVSYMIRRDKYLPH